jgi:hypothetical protein
VAWESPESEPQRACRTVRGASVERGRGGVNAVGAPYARPRPCQRSQQHRSHRMCEKSPVICTPWQAALYPIGRCQATRSINLRQVDPTRRRLFDRRHETPSMRPPMPVPIPSASLLIPNLINRCAIHNDTLAYRCTPLSRMHKYSLEMVLPCLPMDNGVQRFPPSWLEMRALRGGHRDQACLHNFRIRDAEHVGGLFFEQEMQGALST